MPRCCSDDEYPWERDGDPLNCKYLYVCHAEFNAILNCERGNVRGCIVYTTLFPCNECAKAIIQIGIKEVIYLSDKYAEISSTRASKRMFDAAGVKYTKLVPTKKELVLNLREEDI